MVASHLRSGDGATKTTTKEEGGLMTQIQTGTEVVLRSQSGKNELIGKYMGDGNVQVTHTIDRWDVATGCRTYVKQIPAGWTIEENK